jgi:hypothetical protein
MTTTTLQTGRVTLLRSPSDQIITETFEFAPGDRVEDLMHKVRTKTRVPNLSLADPSDLCKEQRTINNLKCVGGDHANEDDDSVSCDSEDEKLGDGDTIILVQNKGDGAQHELLKVVSISSRNSLRTEMNAYHTWKGVEMVQKQNIMCVEAVRGDNRTIDFLFPNHQTGAVKDPEQRTDGART